MHQQCRERTTIMIKTLQRVSNQPIIETDRLKSCNSKSTSSLKKENAIEVICQKTRSEHSDNLKPEPKENKIRQQKTS